MDPPSPATSALKVVRLNHRVPTSCTSDAHQSMRLCCLWKSCLKRGVRRSVEAWARRCRLEVLEKGRGREEDGTDEVSQIVDVRPDAVGIGRERAKREAAGTYGEENPDPRDGSWCPPC